MAAAPENVPSFIAAQLSHLLAHFRLTLKVDQMWSADKYNSGPFDRFSLLIPYCLDFIRWDVIFDAESPNAAPDIIFGPEDDSFHPFHMLPSPESSNNCLSDWNHKDPSRLLTLIQFLRDQYVLYQRKRVEEVDDERLKFEKGKEERKGHNLSLFASPAGLTSSSPTMNCVNVSGFLSQALQEIPQLSVALIL